MERFGIKDAANVTIRHKSGTNKGKVFLYTKAANATTNEWSSDSVYAKAKGVNAIGWDYNKNSTLKLSFEVIDKKMLAVALGSEVTAGSTNVWAHEVLTVSSGTVTLSETPVTGTISAFKHNDDGSLGDEIADVTATTTSVTVTGATGLVDVFYQKAVATAEKITINANKFATNYEIYGDTEIKGTDGSLAFVQMHWLNCKVQSNVSITMDATTPMSLEITFDVLPDAGQNDDMAEYTFY